MKSAQQFSRFAKVMSITKYNCFPKFKISSRKSH